MPLHGKIVVIKRNGADGVEFPLTASCLFGRKPECDIRIQLPQVSKEHCKIELNENKELILTNLSSVNPTCINGEKLQQSERLKHGDLITIIDRSFRFEYPPPPTPKKKRLSSADKGEAVKVLQNQQVRSTPGPTDKKISEHSSDTCLKDGSNLPPSLDQSVEASKGDGSLQKKQKTDNMSPFSELYHMVKKDLASKSPWKGAAPPKSPLARPQVDKQEPRKVLESSDLPNENKKPVTPLSAKKKRRSSNIKAVEHSESVSLEDSTSAYLMDVSSADTEATTPVVKDTPAKQKRRSAGSINSTSLETSSTPVSKKKTPQGSPQKFSADEVVQQILLEQSDKTPKSPKGRRSAGSQSQSPALTPKKQATPQLSSGPKTPIANDSQTPTREPEESKAKQSPRTSPRANAGMRFQVQDVLREIVATPAAADKGLNQASSKKHKCDDLPLPVPKRKRVSFGNQLSPELFDKRLPPNSPLRRGATPGRRSLGFSQKPQSLLRRASTIGLMAFHLAETVLESPTKNASPKRTSSPGKSPKVQAMKTPSPAKKSSSPKAKTPSPKTPTSAKLSSSPKAKTPSPKTPTSAKLSSSPKAKTPSPKTPTSAKSSSSSPKAKTPSPKTPTSAKSSSSSPKAKTPSPKTPTSAKSSSSPKAKTPSPKTPTSAKSSSSPKAKTPSPKTPTSAKSSSSPKAKTPSPKTPTSAKSSSSPKAKTPSPKTPLRSGKSAIQTPTTQGRFSITRIATPSPDRVGEAKEDSVPVEVSRECATPKISLRRSSVKASARKTPKSALKSAFEVMRSRRSGASRANLKVVSSWADIVKFGQVKLQVECGAKKGPTKKMAAKETKVAKPKTPARRLKEDTSTGHADSPATIVVGKAYVRAAQRVGAAPKVVHNIALFKKDMKMDEDLTGVADIFKTPARRKSKRGVDCNDHPESPLSGSSLTEMSVMNTPEESGEMIVSPMSVARTSVLGYYNSEAVTRLLQDPQDDGLEGPQVNDPKNEEAKPQTVVRTPQREPAPSECLTGIKKLMRTPKQKAEPIHDLRGKLLKTPKEPKQTLEESYDGVKELLKTPKQKGTPVEDLAGLKRLMRTPDVTSSPVLCATGLKNLMKTPKDSTEQEDDLTGVKQLMKTPRLKGGPVENAFGVKRLMKTPKQKGKPVEEDLTGIQQMMETPKQKCTPVKEDLAVVAEPDHDFTGVKQLVKTPRLTAAPVENAFGLKRLMKTPKQKGKPVEEDLTCIPQMMETAKQKNAPVEENLVVIAEQEDDLTGVKELMKTPRLKGVPVENAFGMKRLLKTPKQKKKPVEEDLTGIQQMMKTPKQKSTPVEDLTGVKRLLRTPKEKHEPVENGFGISRLVKTPKQRGGEVVEDFTGLAELVQEPIVDGAEFAESDRIESAEIQAPGTSATTEDAAEESEDKENICPVESLKNEIEPAVSVQNIQLGEEATVAPGRISGEKEEDFTSVEVPSCSDVQECAPEAVVEATSYLPTLEREEKAEFTSSAKKQRGCRAKAAQDTLEENEHAPAVEAVPPVSAPMKGRRGKVVIELQEPVSMPSPVRKSARGRTPKTQSEDKEANQAQAVETSRDVEQVSECPPPTVKPKRGRKAEQGAVEVEAVNTVADTEAAESSVEAAPVKAKRGRRVRVEVENPPDIPASQEVQEFSLPEAADENTNVVAELAAPEPSVKPKATAVKTKRGRRAKQELENPPVIPVSHELVAPEVTVEEKDVATVNTVAESEATESSTIPEVSLKSPVPVVKAKRGRRAKQELENSPVVPEVAVEAKDVAESDATGPSVIPEVSLISPIPAVKSKRGRRAKQEMENPPVIAVVKSTCQELPEAAVENKSVPPESVELQTSAEADVIVKSNGRTRRGRTTKKETAEPSSTAVEEDITSSDAVVVTGELPQMHVVKPGRGRRAPLKTQPSEDADDQPTAAETSATVTEPEEHVGTVVKNVRGSKRTKQAKSSQVLEDAQEKVEDNSEANHDADKQTEAPVNKSARGKRTAVIRVETEGVVKRGRRGAAASAEVPPPVVKPARGRRGALKTEQEVSEVATAVDEPAKEAITVANVPESKPDELAASQASSEEAVCDVEEASEVPAKRGRGRYAKKAKVVAKDISVNEVENASAIEEAEVESKKKTSKKAVSWNSDLEALQDCETLETPAAEDVPQQKSSRKKAEPAAKASTDDAVSELKQSADPPAKGRKGRVAKKAEEQSAEESEPAPVENVPAVRRGRAGALLEPKQDEVAAGPKRGSKRKEPNVSDETTTLESVPKRRKGKADSAEAQKEVAVVGRGRRAATKEAVEETPEVVKEQSESASINADKPVRGKRKATQEVESVPATSEDPVSETTSRRGARGQKKTETEVSSAPVRRTRRK